LRAAPGTAARPGADSPEEKEKVARGEIGDAMKTLQQSESQQPNTQNKFNNSAVIDDHGKMDQIDKLYWKN
jgi:hypothetical protein